MTSEWEKARVRTGPRLLVYIPTHGRAESCAIRVEQLQQQRNSLESPDQVRIVVSINGDPTYSIDSLRTLGADEVVVRKTNLGGNANIALAFEYCSTADYLWILGDDDDLSPSAVQRLFSLMDSGVDLICVSRRSATTERFTAASFKGLEQRGAFAGSIFASLFRCSTFHDSAEVAFQGIITSYPHAFVIQQMLLRRELEVIIHPERDFIDYSDSVAHLAEVTRHEAARSQSVAFFGGGLFVAMGLPTRFDNSSFLTWWFQHWHRASMYRHGHPIQARIVDRLAQSRPLTAALWVTSLPPWWKLKDRVRPRGPSPHARVGSTTRPS